MADVKRPFFAANWKMYKGPEEAREFARSFLSHHSLRSDASVVFFPPAISIPAFLEAVRERPDIEVGVQDVHEEGEGAHTGAVSARMAASAGTTWGLAGHSERRREFGDDDERVGRKLKRLLEAGLHPVLCVGETLTEREEGRLYEVLSRQVGTALRELAPEQRRALAYAYEPVWAIGTGRTAEPSDASEAHAILRKRIGHLTDDASAERAVVLYGGSVNPDNIESLLTAEGVDGVLVGGASLDPERFAAICDAGRVVDPSLRAG